MRMSADMSRGTLRAVPLSAPVSSYTRGIPADVSLDFDKAIAQAKAALCTECIGGDPLASRSCTVVTGADLHMETAGQRFRAASGPAALDRILELCGVFRDL